MEIGIKTSSRTVFLGLSLLKISPVNFWFNSILNLCKTTYGNINLRPSSIYRGIMVSNAEHILRSVLVPFQQKPD
jgi:hypothetical protein